MQTVLPFASTTKNCKKCGLLLNCSSKEDLNLHKRVCQPSFIVRKGTVVANYSKSKQKSLDGKIMLSKESKKILHTKKNTRVYDYIKELNSAVEFTYSGVLCFVDCKYKLCGCLFYELKDAAVIICYIWTHEQYKRQGIATNLMTSLEKCTGVRFGDIYCKDPTQEGLLFFNSYYRPLHIKILE